MKILNLIIIENKVITSVKTFISPFPYDKDTTNITKAAEELFTQILKEAEVGDDDIDAFIQAGHYENGDYGVYLSWSDLFWTEK